MKKNDLSQKNGKHDLILIISTIIFKSEVLLLESIMNLVIHDTIVDLVCSDLLN